MFSAGMDVESSQPMSPDKKMVGLRLCGLFKAAKVSMLQDSRSSPGLYAELSQVPHNLNFLSNHQGPLLAASLLKYPFSFWPAANESASRQTVKAVKALSP
jgi:hypothetical protein